MKVAFLALAVFIGLALRVGDVTKSLGTGFVLSGLLSMIGAGAVLILSNRRLWRAALIQMLPAVISIYSFLV
jgi:putative membrane protein